MTAEKIILLTRHAEAEHNVGKRYHIPDAPLTALGRKQSADLNEDTKNSFQLKADLLVSSPLRRPLQTMLIGYPGLRKRLEGEGKKVILLPELQEQNDNPCDTGSSKESLEQDPEFSGLDFSNLTPDWNSKQGKWAPENVAERATWARKWLRDREEKLIVVVAHGDIIRAITGKEELWANGQVKSYAFASESNDDDEALLVPVQTEWVGEGGYIPPSSLLWA
ncbi:phosphoglycerate mutase-like protein [Meredithblackwellia eburnea MCA 4105]